VDAAQRELQTLLHRSTALYTETLSELGEAAYHDDEESVDAKEEELAQLLSDTMVLSDLHGRRRVWIAHDKAEPHTDEEERRVVVFRDQPVVPKFSFREAVNDLLSREPRLTRNYKEVAEAYSKGHVFGLAKRARQETIERVQNYVARGLERGTEEEKAGRVIADIGNWSESYGRLVYRTNLSTALTGGLFEQMRDPDILEVMGAFEYESVADVDTRPNHKAAHGLLAPTTHRVWDRFGTPMGYNCRCGLRAVSKDELVRRRLLGKSGIILVYYPPTFSKAHPDEGFGRGRPGREYYSRVR
jgi:SPP1 gp7 family putative phage head morphogenesis protein